MYMDLNDLIDLNDEELMDEIASDRIFAENATIKFMTDAWAKCGASDQEIEIRLFMFAHDQEQIHEAQIECLQHLWDGGKIH